MLVLNKVCDVDAIMVRVTCVLLILQTLPNIYSNRKLPEFGDEETAEFRRQTLVNQLQELIRYVPAEDLRNLINDQDGNLGDYINDEVIQRPNFGSQEDFGGMLAENSWSHSSIGRGFRLRNYEGTNSGGYVDDYPSKVSESRSRDVTSVVERLSSLADGRAIGLLNGIFNNIQSSTVPTNDIQAFVLESSLTASSLNESADILVPNHPTPPATPPPSETASASSSFPDNHRVEGASGIGRFARTSTGLLNNVSAGNISYLLALHPDVDESRQVLEQLWQQDEDLGVSPDLYDQFENAYTYQAYDPREASKVQQELSRPDVPLMLSGAVVQDETAPGGGDPRGNSTTEQMSYTPPISLPVATNFTLDAETGEYLLLPEAVLEEEKLFSSINLGPDTRENEGRSQQPSASTSNNSDVNSIEEWLSGLTADAATFSASLPEDPELTSYLNDTVRPQRRSTLSSVFTGEDNSVSSSLIVNTIDDIYVEDLLRITEESSDAVKEEEEPSEAHSFEGFTPQDTVVTGSLFDEEDSAIPVVTSSSRRQRSPNRVLGGRSIGHRRTARRCSASRGSTKKLNRKKLPKGKLSGYKKTTRGKSKESPKGSVSGGSSTSGRGSSIGSISPFDEASLSSTPLSSFGLGETDEACILDDWGNYDDNSALEDLYDDDDHPNSTMIHHSSSASTSANYHNPHHSTRQGRSMLRGGCSTMDQRWQDLASMLSLPSEQQGGSHHISPPPPQSSHHPTMGSHQHQPHHSYHTPPYQQVHHPHALYPAHHEQGSASSGVPRPVGVLLHNATLPPTMPDPVNHNITYTNSMGASSHLVSSSLNLTNNTSGDMADPSHHHHHHSYKMDANITTSSANSSLMSNDMIYYQSGSSGGSSVPPNPSVAPPPPTPLSEAGASSSQDGFLSSILGEEEMHLMDMAISSDYGRVQPHQHHHPSSGGNVVAQSNTSMDYSPYRGNWSPVGGPEDHHRLGPNGPQKKHQMYGKRYGAASGGGNYSDGGMGHHGNGSILPVPSSYPPPPSHYPHPSPNVNAMDTTPANPPPMPQDPMELKYSYSMDFRSHQGGQELANIEHVQHNHTYHMSPEGPSGLPRPSPRESKHKQRSKSENDRALTRDEKRARALNLPITCEDIINLPMDEFNERISKYDLSEPQLSLIRDIRRRGKNKVAAQNCRKRKLDQILHLAEEVKVIQSRKNQLISEHDYLVGEKMRVKHKCAMLYKHIFQNLRDPEGRPYSAHEYNLQQSADGSVLLVPRATSSQNPLDLGGLLPASSSHHPSKHDEGGSSHHPSSSLH